MWDYKLIEIKNLELSALNAETAAAYAEVLSQLPEYVIMLFLFRSNELDESVVEGGLKRNAGLPAEKTDGAEDEPAQKGKGKGISTIINEIKKYGLAVNFPNESGEKLENWILKHFAAQKVQADRSAAQMLITFCGNDMYTLHNEIEKLICSPAERPITQNAVLKYCCPNESYKVYELSDALIGGDMKKVKQIYNNLVLSKTDPSMLLGYLSKCYSDMLLIQAATEEGMSQSKIAQMVKKSDWIVRRTATGLSRKPSGYVAFACDAIDAADRKLKRYSADPYLVIEFLLLRLGMYGRK
jgi:DNA polymerase III delta subunit